MSEIQFRSEFSARAEGSDQFVSGIVVPWNQKLKFGKDFEEFQRGAFDSGQPKNPVVLRWQHKSDAPGRPPIGRMVMSESRAEGQWAEFRMGSTPLAQEIYLLLKDGTLDRLSIEFMSLVPPSNSRAELQGKVKRAILLGVAVVDRGAYQDGARIESTRAERFTRYNTNTWIEIQRKKEKLR